MITLASQHADNQQVDHQRDARWMKEQVLDHVIVKLFAAEEDRSLEPPTQDHNHGRTALFGQGKGSMDSYGCAKTRRGKVRSPVWSDFGGFDIGTPIEVSLGPHCRTRLCVLVVLLAEWRDTAFWTLRNRRVAATTLLNST